MGLEKEFAGEDEGVLLHKIAKGDEQAFRVIFDRYRKKVYSYALKIIKSETIAEDILHDVFLKIWQDEDLSSLKSIEAYLRVSTRNHTLNVLRRQQLEIRINRELGISWEETHNETEETIYLNDSENILNQGIALLPPQQKLVYTLCRQQGLKYEEAAQQLSLSPLTVKTHMQHALRFLRNYVSKHTNMVMFVILLQIISEKK